MRSTIAALAAAALAGCATQDQVYQATSQDFGPEPPAAVWHTNVAEWFVTELKDPYGAQFRMGCPVRGYVKHGLLSGRPGVEFAGYLAKVEVNAKNGFGAYAGFKPYIAAIARTGEIAGMYDGIGFTGWSHPRITVLDTKACETPVSVTVKPPGAAAKS